MPGRRSAALSSAIAGISSAAPALAEGSGPSRVQLKQTIAETLLDDWKIRDYEAMRDDVSRTSKFEAAINRRLAGTGGQAIVVDIGTGSFALLALMAARAGAKKVYAIERNHAAAERARETVERSGFADKVQVIEGDSTQVELPERVDLVVSELIGSIATQEGVEPIIRDASNRFLKEPAPGDNRPQMIPYRCQTVVAPVAYKDHSWYQWKKGVQSRGKSEPGSLRPLRLESQTKDLEFLAAPQLLEDFDYNVRSTEVRREDRTLDFSIPADKVNAAKAFSGFAMWTRVVVDEQDTVEVGGQKSHWAYVVALMSEKPVSVKAPADIQLKSSADYSQTPVKYTFETEVPV